MRMVICLITEYKAFSELIDDDGLGAVNLVGQELLGEVVEHELLDGTFHGTDAEVGIVALFCEKGDFSNCCIPSR